MLGGQCGEEDVMKSGNEACCESGLSGRLRATTEDVADVAGSASGGGWGCGVVSREEGFRR